MKFTRILLYSLLFILYSSLVFCQEHLVPLRTNPVLVNLARQQKKSHSVTWRETQDSIVCLLPFLDDFSKPGPYPDTSKWMDNAAFINYDFPICPHTLGVATLDGLNNKGMPYNPDAAPGSSYPADSLTSRPIDLTWNYNAKLHNLSAADSVYFSFYYQPGGHGTLPLYSDTLILQFRTSQVPWTTVWYQTGYSPAFTDTGFHYVLLKMTDLISGVDSFQFNPYDPNFQFRFKNYACTSANVDQWNIDEVYLDMNRRAVGDTSQRDVAFVYEAPSLLANYQYMPWEQFTQNDLADTIFMFERSNDNNPSGINMKYTYSITPAPFDTFYSGGFNNIYPWGSFDPITNSTEYYNNYVPQTHVPVKSVFKYSTISAPTTITITHALSITSDFDSINDTVRYNQVFSDYFAYDDGTAEASYFINGSGQPSSLAYGFTLNKPDTLLGLEIYFSYMFVNAENYSFRPCVWDNTGPSGSPGVLRWEDTTYSPKYSDSLNGFTYYPFHFDKDTAIPAGTFYVGWIQTYGDSLNIGYDLNTDHHNMIYYDAGNTGTWSPGDFPGSMMMRPVFGNKILNAIPVIKSTPELITLYPNPAKDEVTIQRSVVGGQWSVLKIYGTDGRKWLEDDNFKGNKVNTSALQTGVYILELDTNDGATYYQKLVIQR